ncbi:MULTISPECIES: hypothetical protein [Fischerella]|uniref:hypothetical protein n=1 Tax=Fischerella TaxID=1190 RepID=UPI00031A9146|nr:MULTISPECIES: hypothetical protein [Fischerella]MBD2433204.1 hypothetical protein [Fischerella sp. FACHB-380]
MSQDSSRKNAVIQVVPRSPILWSHNVISDILRVEKHHQPANGTSQCCLPHYLLSIHLGQPIQLESN